MNTKIIKETTEELIDFAAQKIVDLARQSIESRGIFTIALAGGSTPRALYALLATEEWSNQIDWNCTHIFFGDERAVAPESELSGYHMAKSTLLSKVPIPAENIHRMEGERENLEEAAATYQATLEKYFPLDLILLGMGDDGHTASLFPNSPVLTESTLLCAATPVATLEPYVRRLTLTFPAINAAKNVWLLVTGQGKAERLQQVFEGENNLQTTPVIGVQPENGELLWLLDSAAASLLK